MASSRTELGAPATGALLTLLAEGRPLTNAEMAEVAGIQLTGETRRRLNDARLVESEKVGRALRHEITEDGVAWCRKLLGAAPPARAGSYGGALFALLAGLGRTGIPLAELFPYRDGASIEDRIREAYRTLSADGGFVGLADVRRVVAGADRAEVDAALLAMAGTPGVHLEAQPDQGSLSAEERRAAVRIGGEDVHMIEIEAR